MNDRHTAKALIALASCVAAALAVPASATVKDGVDAWSRGDYAAAVREWSALANAGDPDAEFNLAQAYRLGRGVETDMARAEDLYAKAAAQGHAKAADNLGLILFQKGKRAEAMPYIEAAAGRGDPRAQYLLGIASFNGDIVARDWPRAYALLTLADAAGLAPAQSALAQMDAHISADDRGKARLLAASLGAQAEANRARDLAGLEIAQAGDGPSGPVVATRRPDSDTVAATAPVPAKTVIAAAPKPVPARPVAAAAKSGKWKVQLGAFGVPGNADRLWKSLSGRPALAGHAPERVVAGKLTILYATGFATADEAGAACRALKSGGQSCLVTR